MAAPNAPVPKGVCKPAEALARLEGLVDVYRDVVTGFLNDDEGYLRKLHEAVEHDDGMAGHRTAHTLKGLSAMCGAESAAAACLLMERESQSATTTRRRELLQLIEAEIAAARIGLAAYFRARS